MQMYGNSLSGYRISPIFCIFAIEFNTKELRQELYIPAYTFITR